MKILIAGGAGFIGSSLVKHYLKNNHQIYVIDNLITGKKENLKNELNNKNLHFFENDLINFDFSSFPQFDIVYDLASPASPALFLKIPLEIIKVNIFGLFKILDFFVKSQSKTFVFASTSEVYGDPLISPQNEDYNGNVKTTGVRAVYDESKRLAETIIFTYLRKYNVDVRIARIFNTYGPYMSKDDGRFISNFINQALEGKPITVYGDGQQTRSCCYIDDMIYGLVKLGEKKNIQGTIINLGNPDERKVIDVAYLIKKMTNSKSKIVFKKKMEDDPKQRKPDITRAKKILNWQPKISLEKGLRLTINYFKKI